MNKDGILSHKLLLAINKKMPESTSQSSLCTALCVCAVSVDIIIYAPLVPSPERTVTVERMKALCNHAEHKMSFLIVFKECWQQGQGETCLM